MPIVSKCNKGFRLSLCVTDICSKNVWVIPMKYKKVITISDAFKEPWMSLMANQTKYE